MAERVYSRKAAKAQRRRKEMQKTEIGGYGFRLPLCSLIVFIPTSLFFAFPLRLSGFARNLTARHRKVCGIVTDSHCRWSIA